MSFTDRKPFKCTTEIIKAFTRHGKRFNCRLCGEVFKSGSVARWIYANFQESPVRCGNFFVCGRCDAGDEGTLKRAAASYNEAVKLAKQWDIYGPEWQADMQKFMR